MRFGEGKGPSVFMPESQSKLPLFVGTANIFVHYYLDDQFPAMGDRNVCPLCRNAYIQFSFTSLELEVRIY